MGVLVYRLLCREGAQTRHRAIKAPVFGFSNFIVNSHAEVGRPRASCNGNRL